MHQTPRVSPVAMARGRARGGADTCDERLDSGLAKEANRQRKAAESHEEEVQTGKAKVPEVTKVEAKPESGGGMLGFGSLFKKRFERVYTEEEKDADYEWIEHRDVVEEEAEVGDEEDDDGWTKW
ncbi:hypothetical protein MBLNU230_g3074t1 [Neophaeotheca triangularis]